MSKRRGTCQRCHAEYQIRKDGNIRMHDCHIPLTSKNETESTQASTAIDSTEEDIAQSTPLEENTQNSTNDTFQNSSNSHRDEIVHPLNHMADPIIDHIPDPILHHLPPTFPNIFYKPADERAVINWTTALATKLTDLSNAHRLGNLETTQQLITAIYHTPHPKAMTRMILPNLTISENEADEPFQDLVGVEDYPILSNSKQSVIWNAIRNGHISKARRAMSSDGVGDIGEKPIRDQILRKYPTDPNRHVPQPIQNTSNIDFSDEVVYDKVKRYIFSFKRGQAPSARGWSMDFWQDLLFYQPDFIQGLVIIISLILNDQLSAENRSIIVLRRGVPLIQYTGDSYRWGPLDKVAAHLLVQSAFSG